MKEYKNPNLNKNVPITTEIHPNNYIGVLLNERKAFLQCDEYTDEPNKNTVFRLMSPTSIHKRNWFDSWPVEPFHALIQKISTSEICQVFVFEDSKELLKWLAE